jgi:HK97 family phage portal protein
MSVWTTVGRWLGFGGALGENPGTQHAAPTATLVDGVANIGPDGALQISAVWACVERRANTIASLPFFVYEQRKGEKVLARESRLYGLLHDSPNARMTPFEFWRAMLLNHDLRGNAYARIDRDASGEAIALWPMPADQVTAFVLKDGTMAYEYRVGDDVAVFAEANVLHLKNLGNGTTGLAKLEFMRATTDELAKAQTSATKVFGNGGKPTGVLMIDKVLTPEQRSQIRASFGGLVEGSTARLMVLEAAMTYQQLSISPEDQQLLESRRHGIEEVCRWFDTPPVLIHHSNVTTWGSGVEQIIDGWHKLTIRAIAVSIEQAVRKRVMTPRQRAAMTVEFSMDALLRGNAKDRAELYASLVQNGIATRAECRQLENLPPIPGSDQLTAQSNLVPLDLMGKTPPGAANAAAQEPFAN